MPVLAWPDLESFAPRIFNIWQDHPDVDWARTSWHVLTEQNLAEYSDPVGHTLVVIRFLAMGALFHGFWHFADHEGDVDLRGWADTVGLNAFRVGEAVGKLWTEPVAYDDVTEHPNPATAEHVKPGHRGERCG